MESLHGSQLRKRPKLWALIEASTERQSRDLINQASMELNEKNEAEIKFIEPVDTTSLSKEKILILKYDQNEKYTDKNLSIVNKNENELDLVLTKLGKTKNKLIREKSIIFMDENFSDSDNIENDKKILDTGNLSLFSNESLDRSIESPCESSIKFIDKCENDSQISKFIDSINE